MSIFENYTASEIEDAYFRILSTKEGGAQSLLRSAIVEFKKGMGVPLTKSVAIFSDFHLRKTIFGSNLNVIHSDCILTDRNHDIGHIGDDPVQQKAHIFNCRTRDISGLAPEIRGFSRFYLDQMGTCPWCDADFIHKEYDDEGDYRNRISFHELFSTKDFVNPNFHARLKDCVKTFNTLIDLKSRGLLHRTDSKFKLCTSCKGKTRSDIARGEIRYHARFAKHHLPNWKIDDAKEFLDAMYPGKLNKKDTAVMKSFSRRARKRNKIKPLVKKERDFFTMMLGASELVKALAPNNTKPR